MSQFYTLYNNLFKSTAKTNDLEIILESNGEYSTASSNHYTPINNNLQASFLNPVQTESSSNSTKQSTTSTASTTANYNPPCKTLPTSIKKEESPFSKFKIWGQKS